MRSREKLRPTSTALLLAALSAATILAASGCAPQAAHAPTGPSPTAASSAPAPPLPTNEEALAIVEELVQASSRAESNARVTGDYSELEAIASEAYVSQVRESNAKLAADGLTITGDKTVDSLQVQSVTASASAVVVSAYGCYDISATTLTAANGANVRDAEVPLRVPVVFKVESAGANYQLVETEPWSGPSSC